MATPHITLTATLLDYSGNQLGTVTNPAYLRIALVAFGPTLPCIPGTGNIGKVSSWPGDIPYTGTPLSIALWGNDVITPGPDQTYYAIAVIDSNGNVVQTGCYQFDGAQTIDLSNAPQMFPSPTPPAGLTAVVTNPPGHALQTINGPITIIGNLIVTGSITGGGLYVVPIVGTVAEFDASQGLTQSLTLTKNVTSTLTGMPTGVPVNLLIKQDATGNWTLAWFSGTNDAPRVNPAALSRTRLVIIKDETGAIDFYPSAVAGVNLDNLPSNTSMVPVATTNESASWRQLDQDDVLAGFSITSFGGGSTVEIGATVTNPAFTASYSALPVSAAITNTDGTSSPTNLTTPFTSGTVVGSFHKTTQTAVTFTLTAVGTTTKTATQAITWLPRVFAGVGTAGATGATASGNNANLTGATGTLSNEGLSASQVGATYGPFSPSGQKIYLLLIGGSHTFLNAGTGFALPFLPPTMINFTNQNGVVVVMWVYETVNPISTPTSVKVNT